MNRFILTASEKPTVRISTTITAAALAVFVSGCSSAEKAAETDSAATMETVAAASVSIVAPADGDTVSLPFTVQLAAEGVEVVPANGTAEAGKGHHHLIIDADVAADSLPLMPAPAVIHMGDGSTERVIDVLTPGSHRIIAVFANGMHVPMPSVKQDTITVIVR